MAPGIVKTTSLPDAGAAEARCRASIEPPPPAEAEPATTGREDGDSSGDGAAAGEAEAASDGDPLGMATRPAACLALKTMSGLCGSVAAAAAGAAVEDEELGRLDDAAAAAGAGDVLREYLLCADAETARELAAEFELGLRDPPWSSAGPRPELSEMESFFLRARMACAKPPAITIEEPYVRSLDASVEDGSSTSGESRIPLAVPGRAPLALEGRLPRGVDSDSAAVAVTGRPPAAEPGRPIEEEEEPAKGLPGPAPTGDAEGELAL